MKHPHIQLKCPAKQNSTEVPEIMKMIDVRKQSFDQCCFRPLTNYFHQKTFNARHRQPFVITHITGNGPKRKRNTQC